MKDTTLDQESAPASAKPERPDPKPDGFCYNCGVDLRNGQVWCCTVCEAEWRRFQRKP